MNIWCKLFGHKYVSDKIIIDSIAINEYHGNKDIPEIDFTNFKINKFCSRCGDKL